MTSSSFPTPVFKGLSRALPVRCAGAFCLWLAWSGSADAQQQLPPAAPLPAPLPAAADGVAPSQAPAPVERTQSAPRVMDSMQAVAGGLTAVQAGRRAAESSRSIERMRVDTEINERAVDRVIWNSIPRLSFDASYMRLSKVPAGSLGGDGEGSLVGINAPPGPIDLDEAQLVAVQLGGFPTPPQNNFNLGAHLSVPLTDYLFKLANTLEAARGAPAVTKLQTRTAEQTAALGAKVDYYTWVQAKLNLRVSERAVEQAQERLRNMQLLLRSGRVASADLSQAEAFAATAEFTAEQARSAVLLSEHKLRLVMHAPREEVFSVGENVLGVPIESSSPAEPYREALRQRPEIAALKRGLEAVEAESKVYRAGRLPRVEAVADVIYANPNPRIFPQEKVFRGTWQVGLQASWSLSDFGVANVDADAAQSRGVKLRSQLNELEEALELEVLTATRGMTEARLNIRTAQQVRDAASASYEARSTLFRNGRATSLEILQAETSRINAEFGLVGAHVALHLAQVRLDHALGRDLY